MSQENVELIRHRWKANMERKVVYAKAFLDPAEALEAAGLPG